MQRLAKAQIKEMMKGDFMLLPNRIGEESDLINQTARMNAFLMQNRALTGGAGVP